MELTNDEVKVLSKFFKEFLSSYDFDFWVDSTSEADTLEELKRKVDELAKRSNQPT